ncbi:MAG: DMT family transporter [Eubacteriales bacterium]|nr:DMT family transporter [Eubacteriales bacterium]
MKDTTKGIILATLTPVLWGLMTIPIRTLGEYGISGQDLAFFRCIISGTGLFILNLFINRDILRVDLKGLVLCGLYGCFCYGISFTAYAMAVARIPVAVAMVLMFLCPVWVSLLNLIVFKEKMKPVNTVSILICLAGAVLVSNILSVKGERIDIFGIICALINGLGAGLQLIIPRAFEKQYHKDTFIVYGFLISAVMLGLMTSFDVVGAALVSDTVKVAWNILFLSGICTLVANYVFVKAANYIDSTLVSIISALEVVVGSLVGFLLYKETLSTPQSIGAVIIVIGALLPNILPLIKKKQDLTDSI